MLTRTEFALVTNVK
ncbi:MAG: hypothetical protein YYHSYBAR_000796 [Candidatus Fervidibacter sacchari]